jgi:hypothetical protein
MASYPQIPLSSTTLGDAAGLQLKAWDRILKMRALPEDIFFTLNADQSIYMAELRNIPDSFFMSMPAGSSDAHSVTYPLLMPLSADALYGTGVDPVYNSEQQSLRQLVAYYNDYVKSVASFAYGIEQIDGKPYNLLAKVTPQLATFIKEMLGYWVRYTIINGYSPNLLAAPTSLAVFPHPNTLITDRPLSMQPAEYMRLTGTTTSATLNAKIAAEMNGVGAGTAGALTAATIKNAESYFAYTTGIMPISIPWDNGNAGYVLTVPVSQQDYLLDPSKTDGLGVVWQATSRYNNNDMAGWPQVLGKVGRTWLVTDPRSPSAKTYGGVNSGSNLNSSTNSVFVDYYLKPGLNDARSLGDLEACFFLGRGGVADVEPEPLHYETEKQMLGKFQVKGAAGSRGFTRVDYDKSTPAATTRLNQSSGVLWVRKQTASF